MRFRNSGLKCSRKTSQHSLAHLFLVVAYSLNLTRAEVRGHNQTVFLKSTVRPFESVKRPSSRICKQDVENIRMRFLDLVEENQPLYGRRRTASVKLPALFVADIARRRADHARDRVLLHVLGHIQANHRALVVEQKLCERTRRLGLADARRA